MKEPKKALKALEHFHEVVEWLEFYMVKIPNEEKKKLLYIAETISELSIEEKIKNRRMAVRLKEKWERDEKKRIQDQITKDFS